jgi:ABC-type transport system involved in multi-copper enzyme maturation permease subunit
MLTTIRYILLTAIRDWLFIGLLGLLALTLGISFFLGSTALVEQEQMVTSYMAGASRVILSLGLVIFVCFHVRRAFENREVEVILTRPISRTSFVFSYWAGFSVLSVAINLVLVILLATLLKVNMAGLLFWGSSVILEGLIVVAFALACSLILSSAVISVLVTCCFYFISRMMGFFTSVMLQKYSLSAGLDSFAGWLRLLLESTSVALPRLDLYGKTKWLLYGISQDADLWVGHVIPIFLMQAAVYIPLLLFMAMFDFKRRQF